MKPTVMIVDDRVENLLILDRILWEDYDLIKFCDGGETIRYLNKVKELPQLILLDIIMPGLDGFVVLKYIRRNSRLKDIPVICITTSNTEQEALSCGASDFISKPFNPAAVRLRVKNQIALMRHMHDLEALVMEKVDEINVTRDNMLVVMADIIEYRSIESGSHVKRVEKYADILLDDMLEKSPYSSQIKEIDPNVIIRSVPMHDVGKIGIPDNILLKPDKLTQEEFEMMKTHTTIGKTIIDSILNTSKENTKFLLCCSEIAYSHHEWFDGTGYPDKLKGNEIPLSARIMSVIDVYDALVTSRVYKKAMEHNAAVSLINQRYNSQFDPVVIKAFNRVDKHCKKIANETLGSYC